MYNPLRKMNTNRVIPTEIDNYFRHQVVQGYVHDTPGNLPDKTADLDMPSAR